MGSISWGLTGLVTGLLLDRFGFIGIAVSATGLFFIALVALYSLPKTKKKQGVNQEEKRTHKNALRELKPIFTWLTIIIFVPVLIIGASLNMVNIFLFVYLKEV